VTRRVRRPPYILARPQNWASADRDHRSPPDTRTGVPPWDRLDVARLPEAFTTALALLAAEVEAVATDPAPSTFENTIVPLEDSGRHYQRAAALFSVMTANLSSPEVQALDREWSPRFAAAMDEINFNSALFARVAAVHEAGAAAGLSAEQRRLVELRHDAFVRAGAALSADAKSRLGRINQELAVAFTDFKAKLLADEDTWVVLDAPADLAGLPESLCAAYAAAAAERGLPGKWAVVNTRSSVEPFLAAASRPTSARPCGRRSSTAATTAMRTTPRPPSRGSSGCAPSALRCLASRRMRTGACPIRWPRIPRRPRS
jgi:Zn-dependent oligopeptidase